MSRHTVDRPHHLFRGLSFALPVAVLFWSAVIIAVHVAVSGRI